MSTTVGLLESYPKDKAFAQGNSPVTFSGKIGGNFGVFFFKRWKFWGVLIGGWGRYPP